MSAVAPPIVANLGDGWYATWQPAPERGGRFELTFNGSTVSWLDAETRKITTQVELRLVAVIALEQIAKMWREEK